MAKDASLFSSLNGAPKGKIYVTYDYDLNILGNGDVRCQHSHIYDVYHVPNLGANLLSIVELTKTKKTIEFLSYHFIVKDPRLATEIVASRILDPKGLYKLCDSPLIFSRTTGPTALVAQTNDKSQIWHEQLGQLNFQSIKR